MKLSATHNLYLPDEIDVECYDAISKFAAIAVNPNSGISEQKDKWFVFSAGWKGLAYRIIAAKTYNQQYADLVAKSTAPPPDEAQLQDTQLFGFSTCALSSIECAFLSTFAIASALIPGSFQLKKDDDLRKYPKAIARDFMSWDINHPTSISLHNIANSSEIDLLQKLRDTLAHRGAIPRQVNISTIEDIPASYPDNPKSLARNYNYSTPITSETTNRHYLWLCNGVNQLLDSVKIFCKI